MTSKAQTLAEMFQEALNKGECNVCKGFGYIHRPVSEPCEACYGTGLDKKSVVRMFQASEEQT